MAAGHIAIRAERDRYVAFAFASADLLIEVDERGRVSFALGAAGRICGCAPQDLLSREFHQLIHPDDRTTVRAVLASIRCGGRFAPLLVRLASSGQMVVLGGCSLPDRTGQYYLSLSSPIGTGDGQRAGPGPLRLDKFLQRVQSASGRMSLVSLEGFARFRSSLASEIRDGLPAALSSQLRACSQDIESVGEIADGRYGLLHASALNVEELRQVTRSFASALDPSGSDLTIHIRTVELTRGTLSESDAARAVVHAVTQFAKLGEAAPSISSLQESIGSILGTSAQHVTTLREIIAKRTFSIALQPIVDLADREVEHLEALSRFGQDVAPMEMVSLAEDVGMIGDFDLAVCQRVLEILTHSRPAQPPIAVNVSGRSWSDDSFVKALITAVDQAQVPPTKLLFEITETAGIADLVRANNIVQGLRRRGYRFCLDDFGAGASSFHYLRGLEVDYVKVDGQFCRDAMNQPRARALLSTVLNFCRQNGIKSIAEMIETQHQASVLRKLGVQLGQGYLFGKPEIIDPASEPGKSAALPNQCNPQKARALSAK